MRYFSFVYGKKLTYYSYSIMPRIAFVFDKWGDLDIRIIQRLLWRQAVGGGV